MDAMMQAYMEETEDLLQRAEECIIRLEVDYSTVDVNELFRMAHTIKGSSYMVGYEDIGKLMHEIEDMLDCVRNGSILFDQSIVSLCFKGLDTVKKMLQYKTEPVTQESMQDLLDAASNISEMVEVLIRTNKKEEEKSSSIQPEMGIISSHLHRESKGENKYYITFFIEEDAPMISPVLMIILNSVAAIGTLVYSSVTDQYFAGQTGDHDLKTFDIILCTDVDEAELYSYFALFYVEKINIVDLSRSIIEGNDYSFNDTDDMPYIVILRTLLKLYALLFNDSNRKIEERYIIESLYKDTVNAISKLENKKNSILIKDFNELYNQALTIYDVPSGIEEINRMNSQTRLVKQMEKFYNLTKGKYIFSIFKSGNDNFIHSLTNFIEMVNKSSISIMFIDISKLDVLHHDEIKDLMEIKKQLEDQDIEISIIIKGPGARRLLNIFDSIQPLGKFKVFRSELDAILGVFESEGSFRRIKGVEHE
ncbi:Hpt domain-containing protein [Paenibacillus sp. sgz500958]|uniref:Hpt domain-containing protein n=1 Tax=Paenibacillus sp. sgz500958 TaxID=3242475 RepID=UPI0036D3F73B